MTKIIIVRNKQVMGFVLPPESEKKLLEIASEDFVPLHEIIKTAIILYAERR